MEKKLKIVGDQIKPLAKGFGGCFATDMITVDGYPVRWMYRQAPANPLDSGWRFFSGYETREYMDDLNNTEIYDVNTIANYDPTIISLLEAPVGSAFEKDGDLFVAVEFTPRE